MAPRKIARDMPLTDIQDEIRFTASATRAHPDAEPFATTVDAWEAQVKEVMALDDRLSQLVMDADAKRQVANAQLDAAVISFTDELLLAVKKDRSDLRWTYFCPVAPSRLILEPLKDQHARVTGWLADAHDPILDKHRADLSRWNDAVGEALALDSTVVARRLDLRKEREALAEDLTHRRDALAGQLDEIARQKGLGRKWSASFFRKTKARKKSNASTPPPEAVAPAPSP